MWKNVAFGVFIKFRAWLPVNRKGPGTRLLQVYQFSTLDSLQQYGFIIFFTLDFGTLLSCQVLSVWQITIDYLWKWDSWQFFATCPTFLSPSEISYYSISTCKFHFKNILKFPFIEPLINFADLLNYLPNILVAVTLRTWHLGGFWSSYHMFC